MSEEKEPMIEGNLFNLENTQGVFQTKIENGTVPVWSTEEIKHSTHNPIFAKTKSFWDDPNNSAIGFNTNDVKEVLRITIGGEFIWCDDPIDKIENGVYGDQMQWMQPFLRKMYQWTHPVTFSVKIIQLTDNLYSVTLNSSDKESKRITFAATDLQNAILEAKALADFLNIPFDNDCDNVYQTAKDLQDAIENKSSEP